jgi:hypothetical protein
MSFSAYLPVLNFIEVSELAGTTDGKSWVNVLISRLLAKGRQLGDP